MLLLVTGAPGVGKDTLLDGAREMLGHDTRFRFVRRAITAPRDPRARSHEPLTETAFLARQAEGGFALSWRSQGVWYGIPADIALDIAQGRAVVANVSRAVLADAAARFAVHVIEITAPSEQVARRLLALGRTDAMEAARRADRMRKLPSAAREILVNDGTVAQGVARLVAALRLAVEDNLR